MISLYSTPPTILTHVQAGILGIYLRLMPIPCGDILDGIIESPATVTGTTEFTFTGGDAATAFDNLLLLFMRKGYDILSEAKVGWHHAGSDNYR